MSSSYDGDNSSVTYRELNMSFICPDINFTLLYTVIKNTCVFQTGSSYQILMWCGDQDIERMCLDEEVAGSYFVESEILLSYPHSSLLQDPRKQHQR